MTASMATNSGRATARRPEPSWSRTFCRGAVPLRPVRLTNVNGTLFFAADDGTNGKELWKSDGTAAGTVMVKDINPGTKIVVFAHRTYECQRNALLHGRQWHERHGTLEERRHGRRNRHGQGYLLGIRSASSPEWLTNVNGTLFFAAYDGTRTAPNSGRATAPRPEPSWSRISLPIRIPRLRAG